MEMEMDGGEEAASWWKLMMIETAKEELKKLESKYPNQFEFFKIELKSFIPLHNSDHSTSSISTQASTSRMKRKRDLEVALYRRRQHRRSRSRRQSTSTGGTSQDSTGGIERKRASMKEEESVEVALERAKACLQKIHELKTQLLIC